MLRLLADENFNGNIVRGLRRRLPSLDLVRAQDVGLGGADDPTVLEWASREGRVLVTHDVETMVGFAYDRVAAGLPMPGVLEVKPQASVGTTIEEIASIAECVEPEEFEGQVRYLPL